MQCVFAVFQASFFRCLLLGGRLETKPINRKSPITDSQITVFTLKFEHQTFSKNASLFRGDKEKKAKNDFQHGWVFIIFTIYYPWSKFWVTKKPCLFGLPGDPRYVGNSLTNRHFHLQQSRPRRVSCPPHEARFRRDARFALPEVYRRHSNFEDRTFFKWKTLMRKAAFKVVWVRFFLFLPKNFQKQDLLEQLIYFFFGLTFWIFRFVWIKHIQKKKLKFWSL